LTRVPAATILCNNLLLSGLPGLFISFQCTAGIPGNAIPSSFGPRAVLHFWNHCAIWRSSSACHCTLSFMLRRQVLRFFVGLSRSTSSTLLHAHIFIAPVHAPFFFFAIVHSSIHHGRQASSSFHCSLQACSFKLRSLRQSHLCSPFPACYLSNLSLADTPSSPDYFLLQAVTSAFCLGSIAVYGDISIGFIATGSLLIQLASMPRVLCHFNWLQCHRFIAVQLASLPQVDCHFNRLHCHRLIAISIGFIATSSLPFHWLHCLFLGTLPFQ
jgi:hypothetical protein